MKKLLLYCGLAFATLFSACEYNDSDLWGAVDDVNARVDALEATTKQINAEIAALQTVVNALQNNLSITQIIPTADGYTIQFSDGSTAQIYNGKDGKDGVNAPEISVKLDSDGYYYWTLDGDWLIIDGKKVRANGVDGKDGLDGTDGVTPVAPQVRINSDSKEWEISTDGGKTWVSTGVSAQAPAGSDSIFKDVEITDDYIIFTLTNGNGFTIPRTKGNSFEARDSEGAEISEKVQSFILGQERSFTITSSAIASYSVEAPKGWSAEINGSLLTVTPPSVNNSSVELSGNIELSIAFPAPGRALQMVTYGIYTFQVSLDYELKTLTFEDEDAKFDEFVLTRNNTQYGINTWSDLIDNQEYGGDLLYDGYNFSGGEPYWWHDQNNTELKHSLPESYGSYIFWGGGHAISNYASNDIEATGNAMNQLTILGSKGSAGHNGSSNYAIHFGYIDPDGFNMTSELPALEFADKVERVIDHLWVIPTNYALNCYVNGNSLTSKLGENDYVKITAIGYSLTGQKTNEVEFTLANGQIVVKEWTKWDLSALGKVAKVEFNILGTSDNGYGFSQPAYFAYDDVAVRFEIK